MKSRNLIFYTILLGLSAIALIMILNNGQNRKISSILSSMQGKEVCLPLDEMDFINKKENVVQEGLPYKVVMYIDSSSCAPCLIGKMFQWNNFITETKDSVAFVFIFAPKPESREKIYEAIDNSIFNYPIYIDTSFVFRKNNIPHLINTHYSTALLNRNNKILLVGNPIGNPKLNKLYLQTIKNY